MVFVSESECVRFDHPALDLPARAYYAIPTWVVQQNRGRMRVLPREPENQRVIRRFLARLRPQASAPCWARRLRMAQNQWISPPSGRATQAGPARLWRLLDRLRRMNNYRLSP